MGMESSGLHHYPQSKDFQAWRTMADPHRGHFIWAQGLPGWWATELPH